MSNTIILTDEQKIHVDKINEILKISNFAFDLSMLGTGKTYTTSYISKDYDIIIVFAPKSVIPKWKYMKDFYSIKLHSAITYQSLRGCKGTKLSHNFLSREDYIEEINGREIDKIKYNITDSYKNLLENNKVLLVIDEIQNIKNHGSQLASICSLTYPIINETITKNKKSKVIFLSGSPIDKVEHALNIFKGIGYISFDTQLCEYNIKSNMYSSHEGYETIYTKLREYMSDREKYLFSCDETLSVVKAKKNIYDMFQKIIKKKFSHSMNPIVFSNDVKLSKYNGLFSMSFDIENKKKLAEEIETLKRTLRFSDNLNSININNNSIMEISRILKNIENAKIPLFESISIKILEKNKNTKLIICLNYTSTLDELVRKLSIFNPLILCGKMTSIQRENVIKLFQSNNIKHRLLICNLSVASTGIDLDDKFGDFPRICLASPMYNTITLYQLGHRFQRMDTKSSSKVIMVYEKDHKEVSVLNCLAQKGNIMKETCTEQVLAGILFPCDYQNITEEELLYQ